MERHLVIGTAGHIDHGKTTLVKALTGVDTDRWAEEKARGITIDIGFAPLDLDGRRFSVVDVPGHEGFIRNMVAGATGVDLALLVVAADEGVMPQTREHVAILRHLGVRRGVVALTKKDAAPDADWRALVAEDVGALLREQVGAVWPVVEVSAVSGEGLGALKAALLAASRDALARPHDDRFRMPVDRVFALAGAGTIVTGTVWSGRIAEGDAARVLPAGVDARVRSVQVHGETATRAEPGRRTALALVGVSREQAPRGAVVVTGAGWRAAKAMDVLAQMQAGTTLAPRMRVRVHHGTAEVMARVGRIETRPDGIAARLLLEEPVVARAADRLVLRSYSPVTTVGGAVVLDPWADTAFGRQGGKGRRALCPAWTTDAERIKALVERRGASGVRQDELEVAAGLTVTALTAVLSKADKIGLLKAGDAFVAKAQLAPVRAKLEAALDAWHAANPLEAGMPLQAWRAAGGAPDALVAVAEAGLERDHKVARDGSVAKRPDFRPGGGDAHAAGREQVVAVLKRAGGEPPSVEELAGSLRGVDVPGILRLLSREGRVVQVAKDRFYEAEALADEARRLVDAVSGLGNQATAAAIRDRLGRSRKYLIPLLEWADREGLTRREGDVRLAGPKAKLDAGQQRS